MPWKASSAMEQRTRFVLEYERGLFTMTDLCAIYGVARETGYYWLRRYQQGGLKALADRGRAPERHPNQTPEGIERAVLELRREHMSWGPRKLKRVLERKAPQRVWPAASTIGALLAREGLVVARKKRRRARRTPTRLPRQRRPTECGVRISKGGLRRRTASASIR